MRFGYLLCFCAIALPLLTVGLVWVASGFPDDDSMVNVAQDILSYVGGWEALVDGASPVAGGVNVAIVVAGACLTMGWPGWPDKVAAWVGNKLRPAIFLVTGGFAEFDPGQRPLSKNAKRLVAIGLVIGAFVVSVMLVNLVASSDFLNG